MTRRLVSLKIRAMNAMEDRESGQAALEYVGMVIIVALVVIALATAFGKGAALSTKVTAVVTSITGIA